MVDFVGCQCDLPYSQTALFGWLHFPVEEKMQSLPKMLDQSIHGTVVKLRCPKQSAKSKEAFERLSSFG